MRDEERSHFLNLILEWRRYYNKEVKEAGEIDHSQGMKDAADELSELLEGIPDELSELLEGIPND